MKRFLSWKILAVLIVTVLLGFFDLSPALQEKLLPFLPKEGDITADGEVVTKTKILLGLDLQGGSQLDYKIDLRKVPPEDQKEIINGVKEVIERRVNGLGVSEPNIYTSELAGETHLIVELAQNTNLTQEDAENYFGKDKKLEELTEDERKTASLEKAKATVGKTIQLEFKEKKDQLDPQELDTVRQNAEAALQKIKSGADYSIIGQEEMQAFPGKVKYDKPEYQFLDNIPSKIQEVIKSLEIGEIRKELIETGGNFTIDTNGQAVEDTGLSIIRLIDKKEEKKTDLQVSVSHILISYKGADKADAAVTRSDEEAYALAKELKVKLQAGEDFGTLAEGYSDDAGSKTAKGVLPAPVTGKGDYVYDFEQAALALKNAGDVSEIVKTQFGYHIIKADKVDKDVKDIKYKYEAITFSTVPDPWQETGLTGKQFIHADVQVDNLYQPYIQIQFDEEGAKLFEQITERNVNKPVAIFVGGQLISSPNVQEKIPGGIARITGQFTQEEAQALARDLNTGAIPAPIVLTGEYTIGATLGQEALNQSLKAGLLGLVLVIVFMILYYRLSGAIAALALLIYTIIFIFLIKAQLHLGLAILVSLGGFSFMISKTLQNQDSGWEKFITFILSCIAFFFLAFLLKTGVVISLAGIAGIVLSIGMAVDANVLIFERFKEELRNGKTFAQAVDIGFNRAWTAIRDSNFSTLITCAILFYFGSSIIRGFAFNLATGIMVSMFTAITITRMLLQSFVGKKISENLYLFGMPKKEKQESKFSFTKRANLFLGTSGVAFIIAMIAIFTFGLNLGIDFKGGTLMEFKFTDKVTKEQLQEEITKATGEINEATPEVTPAAAPEAPTESAAIATPQIQPVPIEGLSAEENSKINLKGMQILPVTETNYIVKTKYLTAENHGKLVARLKTTLPAFTEPRFTTIGPIIGETLLQKAIVAVIFALIMIIVYIGFAFRKMPKSVSPWRFGATAIIALVHDVGIVTGIFAILGYFLNVEIDALFITAMLTVFGYSVNDTIVIFDRLRENLLRHAESKDFGEITDQSLNQTIARSINTSLSTIIALLAVLIWGASSIFYFVLALTLGTFIGTYSSIFVAGPLLVKWKEWRS
ncbi:protein translocase subunit SecF [Candidatus Peregrinibacteria bacterium]|nr:protein translocase subunit SecF [Candidatus Peregrinibacteria bacterium]